MEGSPLILYRTLPQRHPPSRCMAAIVQILGDCPRAMEPYCLPIGINGRLHHGASCTFSIVGQLQRGLPLSLNGYRCASKAVPLSEAGASSVFYSKSLSTPVFFHYSCQPVIFLESPCPQTPFKMQRTFQPVSLHSSLYVARPRTRLGLRPSARVIRAQVLLVAQLSWPILQ